MLTKQGVVGHFVFPLQFQIVLECRLAPEQGRQWLIGCPLVVPYLNMPISSENWNPVLEHTVSFDMIIMVTNRMTTCDLSDAEVSDTIARITVC